MYNAQNAADCIKKILIDRNLTAKSMCQSCHISVNALSNIRRGDLKSIEAFYSIADYLDCSIDYLVGRTDKPEVSKSSNINTTSNTQNEISKEDLELLELFHKLPIRKQAEIITAMAKHID